MLHFYVLADVNQIASVRYSEMQYGVEYMQYVHMCSSLFPLKDWHNVTYKI